MRRPAGALLVAVSALALLAPRAGTAGDAERGRAKAVACAACHGSDGLSRAPDAPHLAGQPERYLVEQLRAYRSGARAHPVMTVLAKGLADEDVEDLAAWFASIAVKAEPPPPRQGTAAGVEPGRPGVR